MHEDLRAADGLELAALLVSRYDVYLLDVRGYRLRTIGPRLPLNATLDPNSIPIPNGANIGGKATLLVAVSSDLSFAYAWALREGYTL